jgi:alkylhydroperoxidase family enzyme
VTRETRVTVGPDGRPEGRDAELVGLLAAYQDAVVRSRHLDPVLTEIVRLRCARQHDCRICQTLRLADAAAAGADDELTEKIDHYETSDLSERHKVALRIVDAFIWRPIDVSDDLVAQAHEYFTDDELAELLVDITKWSTQKIHVTLGTDGADRLAVDESGVAYFSFAPDGRVATIAADRNVT